MVLPSPAIIAEAKRQADAEILLRQREGRWKGGVIPHSEYIGRPVEWIVEKLRIPEHTIRWSLNPEYLACNCTTLVCNPTKRLEAGSPAHIWDGDRDPIITALEKMFSGQSLSIGSGTGLGKAQPDDEPVLTPSGWRAIGELKVGDFVVGSNGKPTKVLGVYHRGVLPVYEVEFSDGATTRAAGDHLWAVKSKRDVFRKRPGSVLTTEELRYLNKEDSWRVPTVEPIRFSKKRVLIDPYLLGLLLGDGSFRGGYPRITTSDPEIIDAVMSLLPPGLTAKHLPDSYDYCLTGVNGSKKTNPLTRALIAYDLMEKKSQDKHVPAIYLHGSISQRLALLQGLLDTDGYIAKVGNVVFDSTSEQLADAVVSLTRSLGGLGSKNHYPSFLNRKRCLDHFSVCVRLPDGTAPFRLNRKLARVKPRRTLARTLREVRYLGEFNCTCIKVAATDSLYVTKDFIVTHNTHTIAACGALCWLAVFEKSIVLSLAPKEEQLLKNMWKEIGKLWPLFKVMFPEASLVTGKLQMETGEGEREVWAASAFAAGKGAEEEFAQRLKGFHDANMLWLVEEAPGVEQAKLNTVIKTAVAKNNPIVLMGQPTHKHDTLSNFGKREWVTEIRMSAYDFPNVVADREVIPGGRDRNSVWRDIKDAGGNETDPDILSQVRGIAPEQSKRALIREEWLKAAVARFNDESLRNGPPARGVDVADSPTGDLCAISRWIGACCTEVDAFRLTANQDASWLGKKVFEEMVKEKIAARNVGVDYIGVGASTINKLKELGQKVRAIGKKAQPRLDTEGMWSKTEEKGGRLQARGPKVVESEAYGTIRDQIYWRLREDLRLGRIALPNDSFLFEELLAMEYEETDKILVAAKDDLKLKLGRSPDRADAVAYGNWVRSRVPEGSRRVAKGPKKPHTDTGLENLVEKINKRQEREKRQFERRMKKTLLLRKRR